MKKIRKKNKQTPRERSVGRIKCSTIKEGEVKKKKKLKALNFIKLLLPRVKWNGIASDN